MNNQVNEQSNQMDGAPPAQRHASPQVEQRLARLNEQNDALARALDYLQATAHAQQDQMAALLRAATTTDRERDVDARLADLLTLLTEQNEQTTQLVSTTRELARTSHVQTLADEVARQEQLEALEERLAKLMRTQFKANTLNEAQIQQLESALSILREVAERRETRQEEHQAQDQARLDAARRQGRRELIADLLPGVDGLELVLQNGHNLVARQREAAAASRQHAAEPVVAETPAPPTWRERLQATFRGQPAAAPIEEITAGPAGPVHPDQLAQFQLLLDDTDSWLAGLALAHERFLALLAAEQIEAIDALNQPFDPRLHVAVDAVEEATREPNVVVQVVRQGYRQGERVLRYAEVVVTRAPSTEAFAPDA